MCFFSRWFASLPPTSLDAWNGMEDGGEHAANPGGVHGGAALLARPCPGIRDRGQQGDLNSDHTS